MHDRERNRERGEQVCMEAASSPIHTVNRIRRISIEQLERGYIVTVGCSTFAFSTMAEMTPALLKYISDPAYTEDIWQATGLI